MDFEVGTEKRLLQLKELDEFRLHYYENAKLYKEKTKDGMTSAQVVSWEAKIKMVRPFEVVRVTPYGAIELHTLDGERKFLVNGHRVKHYWGGITDREKTKVILVDE
uniref:Uncharacterized protein n=1 Tax=Nicotiana tabacum TaxID=4097 RepID=A0A1S3ZWK3_TOBAC|nr:PREDICTED: uncharacterized protein LOC107791295 [Nicotiana tabacum]